MSKQYDLYLEEHKNGVREAFKWIKSNLPELLANDGNENVDYEYQICFAHDVSKTDDEEYSAYDAYFYGGNRSFEVMENFRYAWLRHIHMNKHHWQHWVLINDDPVEGTIALDMPHVYIVEMICDWWSFSFRSGDPTEIFTLYEKHKDNMILSKLTRSTVEFILEEIGKKLNYEVDSVDGEEVK